MAEIMRELDDASFADAVVGGVVLVDFYGSWCPPCRLLEPVVEKVAGDYSGRARVARINIDENPEAAVECGITDIPTLIFFRDGVEASRLFGLQKEETLKTELDKLLV